MPTNLEIPLSYYLAAGLLLLFSVEAASKMSRSWAIPALMIYLTTGMWYFTEVFYTPERLEIFSNFILEQGYYQICIFLIVFRCLLPNFTRTIGKYSSKVTTFNWFTLYPHRLLQMLLVIWILLLIYGFSRLDWNILQALFPQGGRWAPQMWSRGAVGGQTHFIVSAAGYTYALICAMFGVLIFFQRRPQYKILNVLLIIISWPAFYLSGARNAFLAVAMPAYMTYLLVSRQKWWLKAAISVGLFTAVNYLMLIVINLRNSDINAYFQGTATLNPDTKHLGLNMAEELFYINQFYEAGQLNLQYGAEYLGEALNIIPRFIWSNKPLLGHEYNLLRNPASGIQATIAAGFIGRGILNFGPWLGPVAPAILMSVWAAFLARLWNQRASVLRLGLFLVGLGLTPNLGRDISLLVLWPMIFGYVIVRYLERIERRRRPKTTNQYYYFNHDLRL
ncbi:hypothetical protein [Nodularia spumigena]|uniref:Oligosaccharide repeat unit polymerase n=1 Tax=Nodularia spumigena UHCC 0060 TaxID=3110300 RepID=A0ABU5UXP8_NODSP|nr:hypothetical protein [Nodularia spumigena]MEA5526347.1 hypothetical protein [Nodularia spumigena UHCC 0143]MEA5611093.1 hypothetical protein [Nodularia spumigena UHCC 0060]MEA5612874.1 hypothetical protein [Nodularia spumigena UHCC 0040]